MKIHDFKQGSDSWHTFRLTHFGASEAAAMLGLSTKMKRNELLHMKHTMQPKEFSDWVENVLFAGGHEAEELARPIMEEHIQSDLYPITCSDGDLSASCDGLTLNNEIAFEHKQYNVMLASHLAISGAVPDEYMPQCQQVLMITGAKKLIFVTSDGTLQRHSRVEVFPEEEWFLKIQAGWEQFKKDLAEYVPRELTEKPQASAIMQLPSLSIQIKGEVIASNLPLFKAEAEAQIANINTELKTDLDFSNAEANVKYCKDTEDKLEAAKKAAIAQTASIEEVMNTIDFIKDQLRTKRLDLDKKVKSEKLKIKEQIISDAKSLFNAHVFCLEEEIKPIDLHYENPNFAAQMKNKRTLESLHDAADTELARCKILVDDVAKSIRTKLSWYKENIDGNESLFPDLQIVIYKDNEDFQLLVKTRIADQKKKIDDAAAKKIIDDAVVVETKIAQVLPVTKQPETTTTVSPTYSPMSHMTHASPAEQLAIKDKAHQEKIKSEAVKSAIDAGMPTNEANKMIEIIGRGIISHVTINY